ncbi:MAG TPA: polymer-forming cytoskeletal protein [Dokdonella sp.]
MFRSDKRNGKPVAAINTLIAAGTTIRGDVHFTGGLHLEGAIEGSIAAEGADSVLTMSDQGRVTGEVRVSNAVVNGVVVGDLFVGERLELAGNARVDGNVHYKVLEMAAGAQVNGKMLYQTEAPRRLSAPGAVDDLGDAEPAHA